MAPRYRDIVDSHFTLVSTSHVVGELFSREAQHMNRPRSVFLKRKGFQNDVVTRLSTRSWQLNVHQFVHLAIVNFEEIRIRLLADFTFKSFPVHADQVFGLFLLKLCGKPVAKTLEMDEANAASAFARHDAGVLLS